MAAGSQFRRLCATITPMLGLRSQALLGTAGILAAAAVALSLTAQTTLAGPDCKCRYAGQFFKAGDFACIKTSKGYRLAQCSLSENVSSWRFLDEGCRGLSYVPGRSRMTYAMRRQGKPALQP